MRRPFFIIGVLIGAIFMIAVFTLPAPVQAQTTSSCTKASGTCDSYTDYKGTVHKIQVSIPIPGVTESVRCYIDEAKTKCKTMNLATDLGSYLANFYKFFVGIVGILATVMVVYGGIRWILAAGNASRISGAKEVIISAIIGVIIAFTSFLLLYLLNPRLINYSQLTETIGSVTNVVGELDKNVSTLCKSFPKDENGLIPRINITNPGAESIIVGNSEGNNWGGTVGESVAADKVACGDLGETKKALIGVPKGQLCVGDWCPLGGTCVQELERCITGPIFGKIVWSGSANIDAVYVEALCKDNSRKTGGFVTQPSATISNNGHLYHFPERINTTWDDLLTEIASQCGGASPNEQLKGFYLNIEVNDDEGSLFNLLSTNDDNFAIGKVGSKCVPISVDDPGKIPSSEWDIAFSQGQLFRFEDLVGRKNNPFRCDIEITRDKYPSR